MKFFYIVAVLFISNLSIASDQKPENNEGFLYREFNTTSGNIYKLKLPLGIEIDSGFFSEAEECDIPYVLADSAGDLFDKGDLRQSALYTIASIHAGNKDYNFINQLEDNYPGIVDEIRETSDLSGCGLVMSRLCPPWNKENNEFKADESVNPRISAIPISIIQIILSMAGTRSIHEVCKAFMKINLGNKSKPGIGRFSIIGYNNERDDHLKIDLKRFRFVQKLTLDKFYKIKDVSKFGKVHTLTLKDLDNVSDVSALGSVHTLTLWHLYRVSDISALGNVHTLTLRDLDNVSDVSMLGNVKNLTLRHLENVSDVSALGNIPTLTLRNLSNVSDVSAFGNVENLTLEFLDNVRDVSMLGNVKNLTLRYLDNVDDVSALDKVPNLTLRNLKKVPECSTSEEVEYLGEPSSTSVVYDPDCLLHEATISLNMKKLRYLLIEKEISPNTYNMRKGEKGELPLVLALTQEELDEDERLDVANLLIQHRADVNLCQGYDNSYPIHAACGYTKDIRFLDLLLSCGAYIDVQDHCGHTPLHITAMVGNIDFTRKLLESKADVSVRDTIGNRTPILAAANTVRNRYDILDLLLEARANPNDEDEYGTVLHNLAERNGHFQSVQLLLDKKADPFKKGSGGLYKNKTPLDVASSSEIIQILQAEMS